MVTPHKMLLGILKTHPKTGKNVSVLTVPVTLKIVEINCFTVPPGPVIVKLK
jgi:hypothetical protein